MKWKKTPFEELKFHKWENSFNFFCIIFLYNINHLLEEWFLLHYWQMVGFKMRRKKSFHFAWWDKNFFWVCSALNFNVDGWRMVWSECWRYLNLFCSWFYKLILFLRRYEKILSLSHEIFELWGYVNKILGYILILRLNCLNFKLLKHKSHPKPSIFIKSSHQTKKKKTKHRLTIIKTLH